MSDVIETSVDFRVRAVIDEGPQKPYNDGACPILRFDYRNDWVVEQETEIGGYELPNDIIVAAQHYGAGKQQDMFVRYLRIFHGTTDVEFWHSGSYWYATFDTADWRQKLEITDEWLAEAKVKYPDQKLVEMDEFKAWCEGDVWGLIIEKRQPRKGTREDMDTVRAGLDDATVTYDEVARIADEYEPDDEDAYVWVQEDSVWGYYGTDYARTAGLELLAGYTS